MNDFKLQNLSGLGDGPFFSTGVVCSHSGSQARTWLEFKILGNVYRKDPFPLYIDGLANNVYVALKQCLCGIEICLGQMVF